MAAKRVIALRGTPIVNEDWEAGEAVTPGHLVTLNSDGEVIKHNDDASNPAPLFALERDEMGKDIDVAYAEGDQVKVGSFHPGQRVLAWIPSGQNVSIGDYLTSNGAGLLTKTGVSATVRSFQALEALNVTEETRIRVLVV